MAQYQATMENAFYAQNQVPQQYQQTMQHSFGIYQAPQYYISPFTYQPAPPVPNLLGLCQCIGMYLQLTPTKPWPHKQLCLNSLLPMPLVLQLTSTKQ